ncbi:NAD-dependent protein deacetylase [Enhygromyxa salina]|uniref:NAD-dependent protein deacetylase n=1 Tax=Enhygromyxa salina TaxID=215803 RepID=UPI003FD7E9EB
MEATFDYVPRLPDTETAAFERLLVLARGRRVVALTGAGCSTESGIPDYRGEGTRARARDPIRFDTYATDADARARYWARAVVGWPRFSSAPPNPVHRALAKLEQGRLLHGLITQNVDRLHHAAGSRDVIELHGALADVRCLECGTFEDRGDLQARLLALNPGWLERAEATRLAPDGDADFEPDRGSFRVADCLVCGGALKPNVVFFGEQVPAATVERAYALVEAAELLLVLGSSLAVFSGLRFVRRAAAQAIPIAIVTAGPTRGDTLASVKLEARLGELVPRLADALGPS